MRLAYEELLAHHLSLRKLRERRVDQVFAPKLDTDNQLVEQLLASLPFTMTSAQQRAVAEIGTDLRSDVPMQRLLQGDVGSGKTLVATIAILQAIGSGYQAAFMSPTELLSEQHLANLRRWLAPLGIHVVSLCGSMKKSERDEVLSQVASGEAQVIVGTHALFQSAVGYSRLGLVVIDEQHRFGVHQRQALREKGGEGGVIAHQFIGGSG